jgi:hypothetical protein
MNLPSQAQWLAFVRHLVTFGAGFVAAMAAAHAITPQQASVDTTALTQIGSGLSAMIAGAFTAVAGGSALWSVNSASIRSHVIAVQSHDDLQVISKNPSLVAGIPGVKVDEGAKKLETIAAQLKTTLDEFVTLANAK